MKTPILVLCLIACFMHAADDDKSAQLTSCKKWQAHEGAVERMITTHNALFTTASKEKVVRWTKTAKDNGKFIILDSHKEG